MEYEELRYYISRLQQGVKGNDLKNEIQDGAINKWLKSPYNGIGVIEALTGFGKTFMCKKLFKRYRTKSNDNIVVIVPNSNLYDDFTKIGKELELDNYYVYIINTYTMSDDTSIIRDCGLLVLDEVHRFCGELSDYFQKAIPLTRCKRLFGLSATLTETNKEFLESFGIKIAFSINLTEGTRLQIVPEYKILNVGVELTDDEKARFIKADTTFKNTFRYFCIGDGYEAYGLMMACATGGENKKVKVYGNLMNGTPTTFANIVATYHPTLDYKGVKTKAFLCNQAIMERKAIIDKAINKIDFLVTAINTIEERNTANEGDEIYSLSFLHDKEQLEEVTKKTFNRSIGYHSALGVKVRRSILSNFKLGVFKHLLSLKALDEGYDNKKISIGLNMSYHGQLTTTVQRIGRVIRLDEDNPNKKGIFVFIYCLPFISVNDDEVIEIIPNDAKMLPKLQQDNIDIEYITPRKCLEILKNL